MRRLGEMERKGGEGEGCGRPAVLIFRADVHVLQPSPYFQGEYITANNKTVTVEDGNISIANGIHLSNFYINIYQLNN